MAASRNNPSKQSQNIQEWSDMRCLEISRLEMFPAIVRDLKLQKNIINRFLNFYLGGKVQKGLSPRDLIFAVISIMPISPQSEEFIWTEKEYSEDGKLFFLTPDDKLKYDIDSVVNKKSVHIDNDKQEEEVSIQLDELISELNESQEKVNKVDVEVIETHVQTERKAKSDSQEDISSNEGEKVEETLNEKTSDKGELYTASLLWYRLKRDVLTGKKPSEETISTPADNVAFCISFNRLLDEWDVSKESRIRLKQFFAMAALFLLRGKVKTCQNLTKYFSSKFHSNLYTSERYTTPHKDFIKKSWKSLRENDNKTSIMFAKLVILSLVHADRLDQYGKTNIIKFAVLSHTAYSGMGIINMLQQLAGIPAVEFRLSFNMMYTEQTAVSWNRVNDFFTNYLCHGSKQTCHWAGVICSDAFAHLSCSSNYELAVVVAVFIEKLTNNVGVWQSAWVGKGRNLDECKQLGNEIYNEYKKMESSSHSYTKSSQLIDLLDQLSNLCDSLSEEP